MQKLIVENHTAMESLGAKLARACESGCVIYISGELGAGKTTLVRGFLRQLDYQGRVKSPTYTLVEPYYFENYNVFHFDLYRLTDPEELEFVGIRDYFSQDAICLIEWPEKGQEVLPNADILCIIRYHEKGRLVELQAKSQSGKEILHKLIKQKNK